MDIKGKIAVVTGAAGGIGEALARRFHIEGAKLVVCADIDGEGAGETAKNIGGVAFSTDVSKEVDIVHLIDSVETDHGPIDLFCSNAGIGIAGGVEVDNDGWQSIWDLNVMAHVWAARTGAAIVAAEALADADIPALAQAPLALEDAETVAGDPAAEEALFHLYNLTDTRYNGSVIINGFGGRYFEPAPGRTWLAGLVIGT